MGRRQFGGGIGDFMQGFMATYGLGRRMQEDIRNDRMRGELANVDGQRETQVASGEDALAAAQQAQDQALAGAQDDEQREKIAAAFKPTVEALAADRNRPAAVIRSLGVGDAFRQQEKPFADDEVTAAKIAQRAGIYRRYGRDDEADRLEDRVLNRQLAGLQIDDAKHQAERRGKLREVDQVLRAWGQKNVPVDESGAPQINDDTMVSLGKMRVLALSQRGLFDDAMKTAQDSMQYAVRKIQTEQAERQAAVRDAVAAIGMGDYGKAVDVYNRFVPDGSHAVGVTAEKDGSFTVQRKSAVDGAPLPAGKFKNLDQFLASINGIADSNALAGYVERTFRHDIDSRRLMLEGGRLKVAQDAEARAQGRDDRDAQRQEGADQAVADMADAEARGDKTAYAAARLRALRNGVKLDRPDNGKADFTPNPIGMGGTVKQIGSDGSVTVTPVDAEGKAGKPIRIAPQGTKTVPGQAAIDALRKQPKLAAEFDAKFGAGSASKYLDQAKPLPAADETNRAEATDAARGGVIQSLRGAFNSEEGSVARAARQARADARLPEIRAKQARGIALTADEAALVRQYLASAE
jgi:hypothetical protein